MCYTTLNSTSRLGPAGILLSSQVRQPPRSQSAHTQVGQRAQKSRPCSDSNDKKQHSSFWQRVFSRQSHTASEKLLEFPNVNALFLPALPDTTEVSNKLLPFVQSTQAQ